MGNTHTNWWQLYLWFLVEMWANYFPYASTERWYNYIILYTYNNYFKIPWLIPIITYILYYQCMYYDCFNNYIINMLLSSFEHFYSRMRNIFFKIYPACSKTKHRLAICKVFTELDESANIQPWCHYMPAMLHDIKIRTNVTGANVSYSQYLFVHQRGK